VDAGPLRALARVDLEAISRNCERLTEVVGEGRHVCAVVKANGYGHGAVQAASAARAGGAAWLAVATASEAAELRATGDEGPLLVMGALSQAELRVAVAARADVVVWRMEFLDRLAAMPGAGEIGVHVKYDTGMGRLGTRDPDEAAAVARAAGERGLRLAGLMTHFATSDDDPVFMREQLARFEPWARAMRDELGVEGVLLHAANSAATLGDPATHLDMVRCGIAIYGLDPFHADPAAHGLSPALELLSYVAEVKRVRPGESAGYGRRFIAEEETWMATLPIGYGDGVRRALTNNGEVLIAGRRHPLRGTVSMDNVTADLGPAPSEPPMRGEDAVLIGAQGAERISAEEVARRLQTINYEVTCGISSRVPRVYLSQPAERPA
jgi:alanine racemase